MNVNLTKSDFVDTLRYGFENNEVKYCKMSEKYLKTIMTAKSGILKKIMTRSLKLKLLPHSRANGVFKENFQGQAPPLVWELFSICYFQQKKIHSPPSPKKNLSLNRKISKIQFLKEFSDFSEIFLP